MGELTSFLWYNGNAEDAVNFYFTVFKDAKIIAMLRGKGNSIMSVTFQIEGRQFVAFNSDVEVITGGSIMMECKTQEEIDEFWEKLSEGGTTRRSGWLKDRFGISWQIVPTELKRMLEDNNRVKAAMVFGTFVDMDKVNIKKLKEVYETS